MTLQQRTWNFCNLLLPQASAGDGSEPKSPPAQPKKEPVALIVLNQRILATKHLFPTVWKAADVVICADGGANRLHDAYQGSENLTRYLPSSIRGDLDSLRPDVRAFYESRGCEVKQIDDQDSTDFMKCLNYVEELEKERNVKYSVIAYGALGGRFDQSMASINQLFKHRGQRDIYLMNDESMALLLDPGHHVIKIDRRLEGPTCGMIPIGGPVRYTTTGLKWNLDAYESAFGKPMSTSNHFAEGSNTVTIDNDQPLIWTVEIQGS